MRKNLLITLDERVYEDLHRAVGRRHISRFIESIIRGHIASLDLPGACQEMAADELREAEALDWVEALVADVSDE